MKVVVLQLPGADLSVSLSADRTTVPAGQAVTYTMTVTNNADRAPRPRASLRP